jgi:hypothetical protein
MRRSRFALARGTRDAGRGTRRSRFALARGTRDAALALRACSRDAGRGTRDAALALRACSRDAGRCARASRLLAQPVVKRRAGRSRFALARGTRNAGLALRACSRDAEPFGLRRGGELPPVLCSERGDCAAGSDAVMCSFVHVVVVIVCPSCDAAHALLCDAFSNLDFRERRKQFVKALHRRGHAFLHAHVDDLLKCFGR